MAEQRIFTARDDRFHSDEMVGGLVVNGDGLVFIRSPGTAPGRLVRTSGRSDDIRLARKALLVPFILEGNVRVLECQGEILLCHGLYCVRLKGEAII